jgi:hypothetical protein
MQFSAQKYSWRRWLFINNIVTITTCETSPRKLCVLYPSFSLCPSVYISSTFISSCLHVSSFSLAVKQYFSLTVLPLPSARSWVCISQDFVLPLVHF